MVADLDGRQLRYFVVLAEELNFTRAARRIHVAQQTLSDSMQQLERVVGARLLERSPRSVTLTAAGEVFRERAVALLAAADDAVESARRADRVAARRLRVGSPDWQTGIELFRAGIVAMGSAAPDVVIDVAATPWVRHLDALKAGQLDVGVTFASGPHGIPDWVDSVPLGRERANRFLVAEDHPLARHGRAHAADLGDLSLLLIRRNDHPQLHDHLLAALSALDVAPIIDDDYGESFATAVAHALLHRSAIWVVPSMTQTLPAGLSVVDIDDLHVDVELMVVWSGHDERTDIAQFVGAVAAAARERNQSR